MPNTGSDNHKAPGVTPDASGDCPQGQHVLYGFLVKVDRLSSDVAALEDRMRAVENDVELMASTLKEIKDTTADIKAAVKPIYAVWEKAKSGALLLLAAYFLKDAPELLKPVLSVLAK